MFRLRNQFRLAVWLLFAIAWASAIGAGASWLGRYATTPGAIGPSSPSWPVGGRLAPSPGKMTLVVAIHPQCPCTRATVVELGKALDGREDRVSVVALVFEPLDEPWKTEPVVGLDAIPGVRVVRDPGGVEAARFGARTSGHVLVFGPDRRRLFSGGVTLMRGHSGDNPGADAVAALARGETAQVATTPVFGCAIFVTEPRSSEAD